MQSAEGLLPCLLSAEAGQKVVEAAVQEGRLGSGVWYCLPEEGRGHMRHGETLTLSSVLSSCVSFGHPQGARYIYRCSYKPG